MHKLGRNIVLMNYCFEKSSSTILKLTKKLGLILASCFLWEFSLGWATEWKQSLILQVEYSLLGAHTKLPSAVAHGHEEKTSSIFTAILESFCATFEWITNHPVNTYPNDRARQCPLIFPQSHFFRLLDDLLLMFVCINYWDLQPISVLINTACSYKSTLGFWNVSIDSFRIFLSLGMGGFEATQGLWNSTKILQVLPVSPSWW